MEQLRLPYVVARILTSVVYLMIKEDIALLQRRTICLDLRGILAKIYQKFTWQIFGEARTFSLC